MLTILSAEEKKTGLHGRASGDLKIMHIKIEQADAFTSIVAAASLVKPGSCVPVARINKQKEISWTTCLKKIYIKPLNK
jgi:hypothetical protein